jgi:hypothetical protein
MTGAHLRVARKTNFPFSSWIKAYLDGGLQILKVRVWQVHQVIEFPANLDPGKCD